MSIGMIEPQVRNFGQGIAHSTSAPNNQKTLLCIHKNLFNIMIMKYDPEIHQRRSIRLSNYDYSQKGGYFVTICTKNKESIFGEMINGEMILNDAGKMVQKMWNELSEYYQSVITDAFQIMPNHIHGIIVISTAGAGPSDCIKTHTIDSG